MPAPAAFARASVAYKQDGSLVATGVPRYEPGAGLNLLTPNQSSVETDTTGWIVGEICTIARSTAYAWDGDASLRKTITADFPYAYAQVSPRINVIAGRSYAFSFYGRGGRNAVSEVFWFNAAGGVVGSTAGAQVPTTTTGWTRVAHVHLAPAGAVTALLFDSWRAVIAADVLYSDGFAFTEGTVVYPWSLGGTSPFGEAIMVEEGTTNLIHYSDEFDNAYWAKSNCTITPNATTAPDGTVTADKLVEDNAGSQKTLYRESVFTIGQPGSFSVDVWHGGRSECVLFFDGSNYAFFNIVNGTVGAVAGTGVTAQIKNLGADRYRCSISKASIDASSVHAQISPALNGSVNYAGDGASGIYIWRAHAELKDHPTTPHKTSGGTATRAAETLTVPTADVLNPTEGTIQALFYEDGSTRTKVAFYTGSGAGRTLIYGSGSNYNLIVNNAFVGNWAKPAVGWHRLTFRYASGGTKSFVDGDAKLTHAAVPTFSGDALVRVGHPDYTEDQWNNLIDDLDISNTAHSDEKIAADYALGGPLPEEDDTTYLAPFDGSLAATSSSYLYRYLSLGDLRLDNCDALDHGPGLNLGTDEVQTRLLSSGDIDGDEVAGSRYGNTEVFLPVNIGRQATWADVVARYEELRAELVKPSNLLRWGAEDSNDVLVYSIVEPASVPPLIGGRAPTPPDVRLFEGSIPVVLKRLPGPPIDIEAKP